MSILTIGNNEKCPYCETVMTKEIKIFDHLSKHHKEKLLKQLFPVGQDNE